MKNDDSLRNTPKTTGSNKLHPKKLMFVLCKRQSKTSITKFHSAWLMSLAGFQATPTYNTEFIQAIEFDHILFYAIYHTTTPLVFKCFKWLFTMSNSISVPAISKPKQSYQISMYTSDRLSLVCWLFWSVISPGWRDVCTMHTAGD